MTPEELLNAGDEILRPILERFGFRPEPVVSSGGGSGGSYVEQRWISGDRSIRLWVRFGLGSVRYGWGGDLFDHRDVASALAVRCSYPGFSDDPLDAFQHLADDLAGPLVELLDENHERVHELMLNWKAPPRRLP